MKTGLSKLLSLLLATFIFYASFAQIQHAPAYPLITHNTYFSIWSFSDSLNGSDTKHWSGDKQAINGLIKVDDKVYNFMGRSAVSPYAILLPASDEEQYTCRYVFTTPATGWQLPAFDDKLWSTGAAPFGTGHAKNRTIWNTKDIWVRRKFTLSATDAKQLTLKMYHDDNVEVYLNGKQVYKENGYNGTYDFYPITNYLVKGDNVLAVHCQNTSGGQGLDFGLANNIITANNQPVINAKQTSVEVTATQTKYSFTCGKINLQATFTSPLIMSDLDLFSRPVSYISFKVSSNDNNKHDVAVYVGAESDIARNNNRENMVAEKYISDNVSILKCGSITQPVLQERNERINWGYMYVAVPAAFKSTQYISRSTDAINPFTTIDTTLTSEKGRVEVLSTILPFGAVNTPQEKFIEIGYDDIQCLQLFQQNLEPWWKTNGKQTIEQVLNKAASEYNSVMQRCNSFNDSLYTNAVNAGGEDYAKLCALAYRQSIAAHVLVKSPVSNDILFISNENSSGDFVSTVDVSFPAIPMYLLYNTELAKGMLTAVYYYCESGKWKEKFAPHDIGSYPFGNGQTYLFAMPSEETGNMILMTAGVEKALGNTDYAKQHWAQLTKWAEYLKKTGWNPPYELTSDDFAGPIAHSVNLSAKIINAIGAYAGMALNMGDTATFTSYYTLAKQWAAQWLQHADAGDHYLLAFDQPNTWSQKYNLVWDKLLGMQLFPQSAYDKESSYYVSRKNKYGTPLDNRATYTKSDWLLWSATLSYDNNVFKSLAAPIYKYVMETPSRVPMSDYYQTITGVKESFQARSVVGGYFMKMLEAHWQQMPTNMTSKNALNKPAYLNNEDKLSISIQPTPAVSIAEATIKNAKGKLSINIVNLQGKVVYASSNINTTTVQLPVHNMVDGNYIVSVTDGKETATARLVKGH